MNRTQTRVQEQTQVHMMNESLEISEKKMDCSINGAETTG